jgi:hypothetical protein
MEDASFTSGKHSWAIFNKRFAMKLWLKEVALIAVVASAIGLLDGELFYLSQVRGSESFVQSGFRQISFLLSSDIGVATFINALSNIISIKAFNLLHEQGVFALYFLSLSIGSILYFRTLSRISNNSTLSFVLTVLGLIGIVSSTKDLSIALAVLFSAAELFVLTDYRPKVRFLAIPLCFLHYASDTSYLLPLAFYFLAMFSNLGFLLGVLLLLKSAFVVCEGYVVSPYSNAAALLVVLLGVTLALKDKRLKIIFFSILTPSMFYIWQEVFGQRFPALAFFSPFVVAYIWLLTAEDSKLKFKESLKKLEESFNFAPKNKLAFFWLCLAFIFFQTATKFMHPLNEAYLPKEALDVLTESRPEKPPLHPSEVGGYVAYRLAPLFPKNEKLNYYDMSAKTVILDSAVLPSEDYKKIWRGQNPELFSKLDAKSVLCQGRDNLCAQLKADDHWKILSHSTLGEKILQKLGNLPVKQREYVSRRLEEESWYLMVREK